MALAILTSARSQTNYLKLKPSLFVKTANEIAGQLQQLFKQSELRKTKGLAAYQVVEQNRGALDKTLVYILN